MNVKRKEFQELFDMKQKRFEDYTGYSQSTLYNLFSKYAVVSPATRKVIAKKMRERSEEMKRAELIAVQKRCAAREELVRFIETGEEDT